MENIFIKVRTDKKRKAAFIRACKWEKRTMSEVLDGAIDDTLAFYNKMKATKGKAKNI